MKNLKKTLSITLEAIALIGLTAGLIFAFQFSKENLLPSDQNNGKSLAAYPPPANEESLPSRQNDDAPVAAYPPPAATQAYTPPPTSAFTPIPAVTLEVPPPTPTPVVLANGWYLYVDKEAGYSFSYPPDAHLETSKEGGFPYKTVHLQFRVPGSGFQGMDIDVFLNTQSLSIEDVAQNIYTDRGSKPSPAAITNSIMSLRVGKLSAFKAVFQPSLVEFIIFIPYKDKVLYAMPVSEMGHTSIDFQATELFEKILATLTLEP